MRCARCRLQLEGNGGLLAVRRFQRKAGRVSNACVDQGWKRGEYEEMSLFILELRTAIVSQPPRPRNIGNCATPLVCADSVRDVFFEKLPVLQRL